MSRFGESDFGFDSAAAVGFGKGNFGQGEFGIDADVFGWISPPMEVGVYKFAAKVFDEKGNQSSITQTADITVIPLPAAVEEVSVSSFDKVTNKLVLSVG